MLMAISDMEKMERTSKNARTNMRNSRTYVRQRTHAGKTYRMRRRSRMRSFSWISMDGSFQSEQASELKCRTKKIFLKCYVVHFTRRCFIQPDTDICTGGNDDGSALSGLCPILINIE